MSSQRRRYDELVRLDGRVFVVMGAGPGIGAESARALSDLGAVVVCVGRRLAPVERLAREIDGRAIAADATRPDQVAELFDRTVAEFGRVSGIVNVIGRGVPTRATELGLDAWRWQFDNVLTSAVLSVQIGGPRIAAGGGGSIVLVGSIAASRVITDQPLFGYSAAKAALEQLVRCAAVEFGPLAVRVNVVSPGLTSTPRVLDGWSSDELARAAASNPLGRIAEPADVAGAVAFLSCDLARHVTAHSLAVDGGLRAMSPRVGSPGTGRST
jgi:NAD(P)-dependent dehydrogenase (short-subunit alcohol dehydrogenase family)